MSLKRNIVANYVSQVYGTLIAILVVPIYVRYMGIEAYGLIGFFTMLQVWFQLLDLGLTPTMAREAARFRGGAVDALALRSLLRALEGLFFALAAAGTVLVIAGSETIAGGWLKVENLSLAEVGNAIALMAPIVAMRWIGGLYRGTIGGFERLEWLSGFNIVMATARSVLVIPFLIYVGASPTHFFGYQLGVSILELAVLAAQSYRLLPPAGNGRPLPWRWHPLRGVLGLSLGIAFSNSVWVAVTQTDKLVLSKLLSLTEYAYFTLAVLVASGVIVIAGPVSVALQPRLNKLAAEGNEEDLMQTYRNTTQLVGVIAIPAALILAFFSEQVLWAWTGNADIARNAAPVLTLYALGNAILVLGAFPYYLQLAKGDLKLHLIGNAIFLFVLIPALVWATWRYGVTGAGYAWVGAHLAYFLLWIPRVHNRLVKGLHRQWLLRDVGGILLLTLTAAAAAQWLVVWPHGRVLVAAGIGALSVGLLAVAATASPWVRGAIIGRK